MTNPLRPNRFHMTAADGMSGSTGQFGELSYVHARWHVPGKGHGDYVRIGTVGGLWIEVTRAFAVSLIEALPRELAKLPDVPDCSGAVADLEER